MKLNISKSKNSESFYIAKSYVNNKGVSTSTIVRKLGSLEELLPEHGPTREDVIAWAKNEVKLETEKYKKSRRQKRYRLPFMPIGSWITDSRSFSRAAIFLPSTFIMGSSLIKPAARLNPDTGISLISTLSFLTLFIIEYWILKAKPLLTLPPRNFWSLQPMGCTMSIGR